MNAYFISMMAFCSMALAITLFTFSSGLLSLVAPESSLSESVFSRYNNFDYYVEGKKEKQNNKDLQSLYTGITDEDWKDKWQKYKEAKIAEEKHDGMGAITSSIVSFFVFGGLFLLNGFFYRKYQ